MSRNQAGKETSAETFTRIALENKAISDARKIQQSLERERRLVNKNSNIKNEQRWRSFTIQNNPNRKHEHGQNLLNIIICA